MSQYPYQPPTGPQWPQQPIWGYAPPSFGPNYAKRAGWLMLSVGCLVLLFGGCFAAFSFMPFDQLPAESRRSFDELQTQLPIPLKTFLLAIGVTVATAGVFHIVLSFLVRRGGKGSIVTSMVLTGLIVAWISLNTAFGLVKGGPNAIAGGCMMLILLLIFGWQFFWLLQATRHNKNAGTLAHYQAQYWQYQQQQQAYQQPYPPGHGYPPPPPGAGGVGGGSNWAYGTPPPAPPTTPPPPGPTQHYPSGDEPR